MRRLRYALLASLLVHFFLFWPSASVTEMKDTPAALQATILNQPPVVVSQPRLQSARAVPPAPTLAKPEAMRPLPVLEPRKLDPVAASRPHPPMPAQIPAVSVEPVSNSGASVAPPARVPVSPTPKAGGIGLAGNPTESLAPASSAPTPGVAADGLRRYRLALASEARRFKRYPLQATASGWSGTAEIRLEVGSDGRPRGATLAHSSGHEALDRAALTMIDAGALRARLPDSLRGKDFSVTLPVVFNLEDD
ncbi:MAG: TonB family protein [Burkholderiaceae bacterium]|nr:TonB family protein [Burkholderiaceae bacterium]